MVELSLADLLVAASLVLLLALLSMRMAADLGRRLIIGALRTAVQLTLIGLILKVLFANASLAWVSLLALIMLLIAGREVMVRQERRFRGWWGFAVGTFSMFLSSFTLVVFALIIISATSPGMRRSMRFRCWACCSAIP